MASLTFNTAPYFDDFDPSKHFYRVLFKPGYAVQARELNQIQSIMQHQVAAIGNHLFKKNAMVIPGGISLHTHADIIAVSSVKLNGVEIQDFSVLVGKTLTNSVNFDYTNDESLNGSLTALVLGYKNPTSTTTASSINAGVATLGVSSGAQSLTTKKAAGYLYVKYIKTQRVAIPIGTKIPVSNLAAATQYQYTTEVTYTDRKVFNKAEIAYTVEPANTRYTITIDPTLGASVGKVATINHGTFYTKETFADVEHQIVIVEPSNANVVHANIGLKIVESIVTSNEDLSLLDNAAGSPNQYAPGADRYKIDLILEMATDAESLDTDHFIKMMEIKNNQVVYLNNKTEYAELMKMLARRTYDANGNFVVRGLHTSVTESPDKTSVTATVSSGKCYLGGYEFEQIANTPLTIQKPRDTAHTVTVPAASQYVTSMPYFYLAGSATGQSPYYLRQFPIQDSLVHLLDRAGTATINGTIAPSSTSGDFSITGGYNTSFSAGSLMTVTGVSTGTGSITGISGGASYTGGPTTYKISSVTGTAPNITGFKLVANDGSNTALVTVAGAAPGMAFSTSAISNACVVVGYGIVKNIQYYAGQVGVSDIYKVFFEYISLSKGYTISDVYGFRSPYNTEGGSFLQRLELSNITGAFTAGNTSIESALDSTVIGKCYYVQNNVIYVVKHATNLIPKTVDMSIKQSSSATGTISKSFLTNYKQSFVPMMLVDNDIIKSFYTSTDNGVSYSNKMSYSVIRRFGGTTGVQATAGNTITFNVSDITPNDTTDEFDTPSTATFTAYCVTAGYEQLIDISTITTLSNLNKTFSFTVPASGGTWIGSTKYIVVYATIIKSSAPEAVHTKTIGVNTIIPNPSASWMLLPYSDVTAVTKVTSGKVISVTGATYNTATGVATLTATYKEASGTLWGIAVNDTIVVKNVRSGNNPLVSTLAFNYVGFNGTFKVASVTQTPGTNITNGVVTVTVTITYSTAITVANGTSTTGNITGSLIIGEKYRVSSSNGVNTATWATIGAAALDTANITVRSGYTDGSFTVVNGATTANSSISVGAIFTITGTNTGNGSITGYAAGNSYKVSTITGTAPYITNFKLVANDGSDTAIVTAYNTTGTLTGLSFWPEFAATATHAVNNSTGATVTGVVIIANPGAYANNNTDNTDIIAIKPLATDPDITSRYTFDSGNTAYWCGAGMMHLKPKQVPPSGQLYVEFSYSAPTTAGNYLSVDSYGSYSGDLSYIGNIPHLTDAYNNVIEPGRCLDFRTRALPYFLKNVGSMTTGTNFLRLRNLNLSCRERLSASSVTYTYGAGLYVVGPAFANSSRILNIMYDPVTGDSILHLAATASTTVTNGVFYIGLKGTDLSITDNTTLSRSFAYPKDGAEFSYSYVKFKPKHVMIYIDRQEDVLKLKHKEVSGLNEVMSYRRNEFKLPLLHMYMEPYTVNIHDVHLTKLDNPVYHMLDIHELKLRLDHNEYHTHQALHKEPEPSTPAAKPESDPPSRAYWNENFMNAYAQQHSDKDWACTLYDKSYVSPGVVTRSITLELDTTQNTTTWTKKGASITLPYTETSVLANFNCSRVSNLNPFNQVQWHGKVILSPSVDNWIDVVTPVLPAVKNTVTTPVPPTPTLTSTTPGSPLPTPGATGAAASANSTVAAHATSIAINSTAAQAKTVIPTPPVATKPPAVLPAPPIAEIITEVNVLKSSWGPDTAGGNHAITFTWKTNTGLTGRVSTDIHSSPIIAKYGYNGTYAKSLINRKYNDVGVKEYLNAGQLKKPGF